MLLNSRGREMALHATLSEFAFTVPFVGTSFWTNGRTSYRIAICFPGQASSERFFFTVGQNSLFGQDIADVFGLLSRDSSELFERELWLSRQQSSTIGGPSLAGLFSSPPDDPELCLAAPLVILHAETAGRRSLLLQHRTVFNAHDSPNTLSHLSARLLEGDLCALSSDPGAIVSPREDPDEVVTTKICRLLGLDSRSSIPRDAFILAANRECLAGLGLSIDPGRFVWHTECNLTTKSKRLFFQIFSLELTRVPADEVRLIAARRPYASMSFYSRSQIQGLAQTMPMRLNTLLSARLEDLFMPIYDHLGVE